MPLAPSLPLQIRPRRRETPRSAAVSTFAGFRRVKAFGVGRARSWGRAPWFRSASCALAPGWLLQCYSMPRVPVPWRSNFAGSSARAFSTASGARSITDQQHTRAGLGAEAFLLPIRQGALRKAEARGKLGARHPDSWLAQIAFTSMSSGTRRADPGARGRRGLRQSPARPSEAGYDALQNWILSFCFIQHCPGSPSHAFNPPHSAPGSRRACP